MKSPTTSIGINTPVTRANVRTKVGLADIDTPITAASVGIMGRMYGASLEEDAEKKRSVIAENISKNFNGLKPDPPLGSNQALRMAAGIVSSQGNAPMASRLRKYHHGSSRL